MTVQTRFEFSATPTRDSVTLEILKNALESLADEMALIVLRSAYSPIVRDSMDYSTAVCDSKGRVIAQGLTNPIHLGSFPRVMQSLMNRFASTMGEGDGFIVNDPYDDGGMHLPDIYFIRPIYEGGRRVGFTAVLVHHTDLGGMAPGSMALNAVELFQEGLRIPLMRLYRLGEPIEAVFALLRANSRMPEEVMGDLRAQISACDTVGRSLAKLAAKHGENFDVLIEELHNYAERLVRQRLEEMPDGIVTGEDYIDGLGEAGERITFKVAITVKGSDIFFDWQGTSGTVQGSINCPITTTWSLTYAALRTVLGPGVPNCEGYMRPIRMEAPLGCILNPRPYAACGARGVIGYRMLDTCFAAFSKLVPGIAPAGAEGGPSVVTLSGKRANTHEQWLVTDSVLGSWGGRKDSDGPEGISSPGANLSNQPIELIEARLPVRIEEYGYIRNSGGAGRSRGGSAMVRSFVLEADTAELTLRSDRRKYLPLPVEGGLPGSPSISFIQRSEGGHELLPTMNLGTKVLRYGDKLVHIAAGGAGYGDPLERPIDQVISDLADGLIEKSFARTVYGVVLATDGKLDSESTRIERETILAADFETRADRQHTAFLADLKTQGVVDVGNLE